MAADVFISCAVPVGATRVSRFNFPARSTPTATEWPAQISASPPARFSGTGFQPVSFLRAGCLCHHSVRAKEKCADSRRRLRGSGEVSTVREPRIAAMNLRGTPASGPAADPRGTTTAAGPEAGAPVHGEARLQPGQASQSQEPWRGGNSAERRTRPRLFKLSALCRDEATSNGLTERRAGLGDGCLNSNAPQAPGRHAARWS